MERDNSGIFAEVFKDYKPPQKDIVGRLSDAWGSFQEFRDNDPIFGANSKNPFQFDFLGVVGGPTAVARAMKADPAGYGKKLLDYLKQFSTQVKSGEIPTKTQTPGVYSGSIFDAPLQQQMYDDIGTLLMPYTRRSATTGREQFVPALDLGMPDINRARFDRVKGDMARGKLVPMSEFASWQDAQKLYPGVLDDTAFTLAQGGSGRGYAIGDALYDYVPRTAGGIVKFRNPGIFDDFGEFVKTSGHELEHGRTLAEGMSTGSSPGMFTGTHPAGLMPLSTERIYQSGIDEIIARASEVSPKGQLLGNIRGEMPYMPHLAEWFGTPNPVIVREELDSIWGPLWNNISGEHYGRSSPVLMGGLLGAILGGQ